MPQQVHPMPYGYSYPPVYYPPTVMPTPPVYTPSAPPQPTVVTTKKSEKTIESSNSTISFQLNGKQVSVTNPDPLMRFHI